MPHRLQNEVFAKTEDFIDKICSLQDMHRAISMALYTDIYDYLTNSGPQLHEGDLYHHIEICLQTRLENICQSVNDMTDADVLRLYEMHWKKYKRMCICLNNACQYLNRHWVRREYNSGRSDVYEIDVFSQRIWENVFFKPLFPRITRTCLNLINTNRINRSSIDAESIKNILQLYLEQEFTEKKEGLINDDSTKESINDIYKEYFEIQFLQEAEDFYLQQHIPSLESKNSIIEYLIPVAEYFDQEINFAKSYLPESKSTLQMLIDRLEDLLIADTTFNIITNEVKRLVSTENSEKLGLLYQPISRIPKIRNEAVKFIESHIYEMGMNAIERVSGTAINDPAIYIKTIIDTYKKYLKFVQEVSSGEQVLIAAFDKACVKFINNNAVTQAAGSTTKSSELLARYCDTLLRKGNEAVEEIFDQIMVVFNYIEDKDIFLKFYERMLAKRLIHQSSVSNNYEELMISNFKQQCGCEYTSKLEQMYKDIVVSKTLTDQYRIFCESKDLKGILDFSVMVLSSNSWPFSSPPNFILPIELIPTLDSFTKFYTHCHNGRKLTWLHQHSKAELQIFFNSKTYILQVSTYQLAVLFLFNESNSWTVERIQEKTQIKSELLIQILCGLLKSKLLVCTEINEDFEETEIQMNYSIRLANDYTSKKVRINLNVPLKSVKPNEMKRLDETIEEDRKMVIQAAIIRIMKGRQTLKHALLMQEVMQQLSSRFKPKIPVIKKCVDILIEKDYLERDSNEKDVLRYLS